MASGQPVHSPAPPSLLPRLTFTQGLVVGQLSIIIVVAALVRYLLFEDRTGADDDEQDESDHDGARIRRHFPPTSPKTKSKPTSTSLLSLSLSLSSLGDRKSPPLNKTHGHRSDVGVGPTTSTLASIPDAVGYDMETAADVDVGWLNVLLAHVWEGYRDDLLAGGSKPRREVVGRDVWEDVDEFEQANGDSAGNSMGEGYQSTPAGTALAYFQEILNRPKVDAQKLDFLDPIIVTDCQLGSSYPILSNARVRPRDDQGRVRIEVDVDYTDLLTLSLQTAILINFPRKRFAVLPVSLGLRITRFSGTLSLSLTSHSAAAPTTRSRHSFEVSLHPDFLLSATCSSLVGSRAKLQDIPKIQQLILQRIRAAIQERIGWPKVWTLALPDLVRRRPKTRSAGRASRPEGEHMLGHEYEDGSRDQADLDIPRRSGVMQSTAQGDAGFTNGRRHFDNQRTPKAKQRRPVGLPDDELGAEGDDYYSPPHRRQGQGSRLGQMGPSSSYSSAVYRGEQGIDGGYRRGYPTPPSSSSRFQYQNGNQRRSDFQGPPRARYQGDFFEQQGEYDEEPPSARRSTSRGVSSGLEVPGPMYRPRQNRTESWDGRPPSSIGAMQQQSRRMHDDSVQDSRSSSKAKSRQDHGSQYRGGARSGGGGGGGEGSGGGSAVKAWRDEMEQKTFG